MDIRIDKEFQALIPPLAAEERKQLEENILAEGCRDPLVVWPQPKHKSQDGVVWKYDQPTRSGRTPEGGEYRVWESDRDVINDEEWPMILIDGHNRYEICTRNDIEFRTVEMQFDSREDAKIWIIKNQFGRRNLQPFTRVNLNLQLEPLIAAKAKANQKLSDGRGQKGSQNSENLINPVDRYKEIGKASNTSHDTVAKVKVINKAVEAGKVAPEVVAKLHTGEVSINRVARDVKETMVAEKRAEQRKEAAAKVEPQFFDNVHIGDFRKLTDKVADGSLSLIFTDPPYDRKAIDLFDGLGEFAADKLADGGSLIAYVGHIQIPDALEILSKHLRYWWVCCCLHSGGESLMKEYGIRVGWKAMLWFVKGTRDDKQTIVHDVVSGGREKSHHDWQQAQSEAEYWIDNLCPEDGIVCDPFLGGGTTAAAAIRLNRKWIGFEKDHDQAVLAMSRCRQ
jgi:16S rRNA G966 N2-methylase RsmD